jgi:hypothetical protein
VSPSRKDPVELLAAATAALAAISDPEERLRAATGASAQIKIEEVHIADIRRAAVQELVAAGWSYQRIADEYGVTRAAAHKWGLSPEERRARA